MKDSTVGSLAACFEALSSRFSGFRSDLGFRVWYKAFGLRGVQELRDLDFIRRSRMFAQVSGAPQGSAGVVGRACS